MSRADWRNGYRNGANYLLGTNSKGIHSRPLVSIESCYSVNSKGKSLCAGLYCSVVERVQVSKWSPSRPCYVLSVIQYLCRKVGKLCRDNFNEKQINKSEEIGFRVRRDTEFRTRLRCKDLYRFLCQILSHGIKSSSETLIYLRSATFSFISTYVLNYLINELLKNGISWNRSVNTWYISTWIKGEENEEVYFESFIRYEVLFRGNCRQDRSRSRWSDWIHPHRRLILLLLTVHIIQISEIDAVFGELCY